MNKIYSVLLLVGLIGAPALGAKITFDSSGVMQIDGKKTFVISFGMPAPAEGKTPEGKDGLAELHDAGANFARIAPQKWPTEEAQGSPARWRDFKGGWTRRRRRTCIAGSRWGICRRSSRRIRRMKRCCG